MSNLINCGTCGYPLAPEERTTLVEKDGVMVKPAREWVGLTEEDYVAINASCLTKLQAATSTEAILREKNK